MFILFSYNSIYGKMYTTISIIFFINNENFNLPNVVNKSNMQLELNFAEIMTNFGLQF